ncbi:MAG: toprim domain-containing protein [Balneolaceae bacterium]
MSSSLYTLLIVESSMTARRIQQLVPPHIFVIATDGFIWKPAYDSRKKILKKRAIPDKLDLRKEIKQQADIASKVIIATDNDPSGDFIAWSLAKYQSGKPLLRSFVQSISKTDILRMIQNAAHLDENTLLYKLQNRYLIQQVWNQHIPRHTFKEAGTIALKNHQTYSTFRSNNEILFKTNQPISCKPGEWLTLHAAESVDYVNKTSLSTFDVVADSYRELTLSSYAEGQKIVNQLFHKTYPDTDEGLISYPRTAAQGFYQTSWQRLQDQWVHFDSLEHFKPDFLQTVIAHNEAHESVHPYDIRITPQMVSKSVQKPFSGMYKIIYDETINAISQPKKAGSTFCLKNRDPLFYSDESLTESTIDVTPVFTVAEWGQHLCNLGVLRPSGFGVWVDEAVDKALISIKNGSISTERLSTAEHQTAEKYHYLLKELNAVSDQPHITDETLSGIFAS